MMSDVYLDRIHPDHGRIGDKINSLEARIRELEDLLLDVEKYAIPDVTCDANCDPEVNWHDPLCHIAGLVNDAARPARLREKLKKEQP